MKKLVVNKKYDGKKLNKFLLDNVPNLTYGLFCNTLRKKDIKINGKRVNKDISIFEKINKLSYGIYICHPWLIDSITSNKIIISIARDYTLLFPLFLFLFALGVSMFFSKLMLKTKIGRFLIG